MVQFLVSLTQVLNEKEARTYSSQSQTATGNFQPKKNHRKCISRVGRVPVKYWVVHVAIVSLCNARGLSVRAPHDGGEALAPPVAPSLTLPGPGPCLVKVRVSRGWGRAASGPWGAQADVT